MRSDAVAGGFISSTNFKKIGGVEYEYSKFEKGFICKARWFGGKQYKYAYGSTKKSARKNVLRFFEK